MNNYDLSRQIPDPKSPIVQVCRYLKAFEIFLKKL